MVSANNNNILIINYYFKYPLSFFFSRQGFSVAFGSYPGLALVDQASLKLTEISLPLPPKCWN